MTYKRGQLTVELHPVGERELAWSCLVPFPDTGVYSVAYQLLDQGYRNFTSHPLRLRLAHPRGHRIDILPARRAIRIRLERGTRAEERLNAALTVVDDICDSLGAAQRTRTMW